MIGRLAPLLAALLLTGGGALGAPEVSIRPVARPAAVANAWQPRPVLVPVYYRSDIRPQPRPLRAGIAMPVRVVSVVSARAIGRSPRPEARPDRRAPRIETAAVVRTQPVPQPDSGAGRICGDKAIRGYKVERVRGEEAGCGIRKPVKVTSIDGVALSTPATLDCDTAQALKTWVREGVKPAVGRLGGGVASLRVVASYSCRSRNSQPGAKLSEHAKGKAVDVAAVTLNNGVSISVLKGWRDPVQGKLLRRMHKAACGPFGTVLGPDADRYHQDHLHLDIARHRSGSYCR